MHAGQGAKIAKWVVTTRKVATDIWVDLGLQEILDIYDPNFDSTVYGVPLSRRIVRGLVHGG